MAKFNCRKIMAIGFLSCLTTGLYVAAIKTERKEALKREEVAWIGEPIEYDSRDNKMLSLESEPWLMAKHPMAAKKVMIDYNLILVDQTIHHRSSLPGGITFNHLTAGWIPLRDRILAGEKSVEKTDWLQLCEDQDTFWSDMKAYQSYVALVKSKSSDGEWHSSIAKETPDPSEELDFRASARAGCAALDGGLK